MILTTDAELGYPRQRHRFWPGEALRLDEGYRLAHLPLVAPAHPDVIRERPGTDYVAGRYAGPRRSLIVPVPADVLEASPAFQALDRAMRQASFAPKIAWEVMARRRDRLHLSVAAGLRPEEIGPVVARVLDALAGLGPFAVRVGGPFVGDRNHGRVYLAGYPELRDGRDLLSLLQEAAGRPRSGVYLLGYYNLTDHLDPEETAALAAILDAHAEATMATLTVDRLWLLETHDDLVLESRVLAEIAAPGAQTQMSEVQSPPG